jgi:hypothetical protein
MSFTDLSLDKFWISVKEEYPALHWKAINTLLRFSTPCTREQVQQASKTMTERVSFQ